jgi:hypothetical protein
MKFLRMNYHIVVLAVTILVYTILAVKGIIVIDNTKFNVLITIAIATEGFLFTSLSIMLASADKAFIKILRKYGSMRKIEFLVTTGMVSSGLSIIFYLCDSYLTIKSVVINHLVVLGVLIGTACFIFSSFKLFRSLKLAEKFDRGDYQK